MSELSVGQPWDIHAKTYSWKQRVRAGGAQRSGGSEMTADETGGGTLGTGTVLSGDRSVYGIGPDRDARDRDGKGSSERKTQKRVVRGDKKRASGRRE